VIKPEQIPDEVVKAARHAFYNATGPTISDDWRTALIAGLAAWPGAEDRTSGHYPNGVHGPGKEVKRWLQLPLTQENNNADG